MSYRVSKVDSDYIERQNLKESSSKKFPKCYKVKVNIGKVNLEVIKEWISKTINEQLEDDDIVIDYIYELLQSGESNPDIKALQLQVQEFLGADEARKFCEKLWNLLISAQDNKDGIPKQILDERQKHKDEVEKFQLEVKKKLAESAKAVESKAVESLARKTNYNRSQSDKGLVDQKTAKQSNNHNTKNESKSSTMNKVQVEDISELYTSERRSRTVYNAAKKSSNENRERERDRSRSRDRGSNNHNKRNRSRDSRRL